MVGPKQDFDITKTYILGSVSRFALNNKEMHYGARVNTLAETAYLFPSGRVKYIISSPYNLNFGVILP